MKNIKKWILAGVAVFAVLLIAALSFTIVPSGTVGVVATMGAVRENVMTEGLHIKAPFITQVIKMNVRTQKVEADCAAASKDLQTITTKVAINYRVNAGTAATLYKTVGRLYEDTLIVPAIQESVKAVIARFSAEELITKRQEVSVAISEELSDKISSYGFTIEIFNILNLDFSAEFNAAIEAKQTAQQSALKAEQDLNRIKIEAQQKVEQAKAEAEATRAKADAEAYAIQKIQEELAKSDAYANYQKIQKWNGELPQVQGDSNAIVDLR